jgi:hypothetical protein
LIKGDGGNSDRRRHEFEIANHYNKDFTPEMEFGKGFSKVGRRSVEQILLFHDDVFTRLSHNWFD